MEQYWSKFAQFVKNCFASKFKAFMPGVLMGFIGSQHLLWIGVSLSVVETILKSIGTILMAFGSGLATSYAAYLVECYKEKKSSDKNSHTKRKNRRAA